MGKFFRSLAIIFPVLIAANFTFLSPRSSDGSDKATQFKPRAYTAYLIGHAHIDLAWLWRWEETVRDIATHTFLGTLSAMDKLPGLTFAQSQAALYEAMERDYPDIFARIRSRIREGTWAPVGGMWVEPDLNMPDGESLTRQLLYGKRYFLDKFGVDVRVGWNPDSFGHNWQLPQLLCLAGITSYVFVRCAPPPDPTHFFFWEGMDGSRILSYVPPGRYNVNLRNGVRDIIKTASKNTDIKDFMLLYGEGDHGGGPRDSDLEAVANYRIDENQPKLEFVVPDDYFKKIEAAPSFSSVPTVKKELNFTFPACYTTQAADKKNNRLGENLLLTAEKFSALAFRFGFRHSYPERDIDEAWKIILRNQFHDILDGSSIGPVYEEAAGYYKEAFERGQRALDFSLETITNQINTRGEGIPLVVYNPLFWERTDAVMTEVELPRELVRGSLKLVDARGAETPLQILERQDQDDKTKFKIAFVAQRVPSFGYIVYHLSSLPTSPSELTSSLSGSPTFLENEYFRLAVDPKTGWITSLIDKRAGRQVLSVPGNVLQVIVDRPKTMSAWNLGLKETLGNIGDPSLTAPPRIELVESGPVRALIRVKNVFRSSTFTQDLILYAAVPRVDCRVRLDWQERNLMIKAAFPVNIKNETATFEIPYGAITRPADGTEVPALRWIDLSDASGSCGVSLLNDCKYGFDVKGNTMRLSIIHGATGPDPEADRGCQELLYSLYPHSGTWKEAQTVRRGYEINNPLLVRSAMVHEGPLPPDKALVLVEPENVVVSALKKEMGYGNNSLILHLYETQGKKSDVRITFPWPVIAQETDLIERPVRTVPGRGLSPLTDIKTDPITKTISFTLSPYQIKIIRIAR
jgi:alpha-mannosidase